jgi:hypothetical protein
VRTRNKKKTIIGLTKNKLKFFPEGFGLPYRAGFLLTGIEKKTTAHILGLGLTVKCGVIIA